MKSQSQQAPQANPVGNSSASTNFFGGNNLGANPVGGSAASNPFGANTGVPSAQTPNLDPMVARMPGPASSFFGTSTSSGTTGIGAPQAIADPVGAFSGGNAPITNAGMAGSSGTPAPDPHGFQAFYSDPNNYQTPPSASTAAALGNTAAAMGDQFANLHGTGPVGGSGTGSSTNAPLSNEWGSVLNAVGPAGPIQTAINTSNVPGLVGGDALAQQAKQAQDAAYQNATGYLDPQWQNQQTQLQNQLAAQGVMQNSEAWNKAMDDFARQKQFAYQQAQSNAFQQGLAAQGQLFNQGLQANQNQFGQNLQSGQFANAAQEQGYNQNLQNATFANAAQNQIASQGLQNRQIASQLEGQRYAANAAGAAASAQAAASMANVQAQIQAQQQQNAFLNSMSLRNQGINELLLQQQNPLQVLSALNGGQGVTQPNFTNTPGANVGNTDIMQAIQNAYQGQLTGYNAQVGASNSNNAAMASIIAAMICDRRLKKNIRKIGVLESGCALYEFEYLWGEKGVGPMADEVERVKPEAVFTIGDCKVVNMARL